jgi:hypothetical protein
VIEKARRRERERWEEEEVAPFLGPGVLLLLVVVRYGLGFLVTGDSGRNGRPDYHETTTTEEADVRPAIRLP